MTAMAGSRQDSIAEHFRRSCETLDQAASDRAMMEAMLRATERLDRNVVVLPFAETGGMAELIDLVARHRPHVVHLSGHGTVGPQGMGWFAFVDSSRTIA